MKAPKKLVLAVFFIFQLQLNAQSVYDSLKMAYSDAYLFEKFYMNKRNISFEEAINYELRTIWNDSIRELACVAVYDNAFGFNWTDSVSLNQRIDSIIRITRYFEIKDLAKRIRGYANTPLIGQKLVTIDLQGHNGTSFSTEKFRGDYFVINLWATWSKDCIRDMKAIPGIAGRYNIRFYSISFDEEYDAMTRHVKHKKYNWPVVYAGRWNELWSYFKIRHIPKYIVIDPEGIIIAESFEDLEETIAQALAGR
jgi:thiol-disulfide isomerase/thioredoxin